MDYKAFTIIPKNQTRSRNKTALANLHAGQQADICKKLSEHKYTIIKCPTACKCNVAFTQSCFNV